MGLTFRAVGIIDCDDEVMHLQDRIAAVADDSDPDEVCRRKVANRHRALERKEAKIETAGIIGCLADAMVLTPKDGALRIDLHGELTGIPALASDCKKSAAISHDGLAQVSLVAGAGFEPTTFRL